MDKTQHSSEQIQKEEKKLDDEEVNFDLEMSTAKTSFQEKPTSKLGNQKKRANSNDSRNRNKDASATENKSDVSSK